mgnify:CR=1 FL=1
MKKLKRHQNRLRINKKRFPWELVKKDGAKNAKCKYCGRTPLVDGFDVERTINDKKQFSCFECYQVYYNPYKKVLIDIELNPDYVKISKKRLKEVQTPML